MKNTKITKAGALRELVTSKQLNFLMESHNGLSAKIAQEAGFDGLWGSGLSISAACGVRDNNEMSWTQVLEVLEYISDATTIPMLLDGDTGYGNFNNMRRLVTKLEARDIAGVCIEDKLFPKQNSFIDGGAQPLADIDEFCGKIKAGKDAQQDDDFVIVARVEAFIAGWGLDEALKRAEAYRKAGADAILMHSKISRPDEVLAFKKQWGDRSPVIIVPTKYYSTPTEVFKQAGFNVVIWANHLMRTCITAMQRTAQKLFDEQTLINIEEKIVPVAEVFRLQGADELKQAEAKYLPKVENTKALILAASRGIKLGDLTKDKPKTMIPISGKPLLAQMTDTLNDVGVKNIKVVRGYKKEVVNLPGLEYVDNDDFESTKEVYSLKKGLESMAGETLVCYGDVLFHRYVPLNLTEVEGDIVLAVDANAANSQNLGRYTDLVVCDAPYSKIEFSKPASLKNMTSGEFETAQDAHGEWIGMFKLSADGINFLKNFLANIDDETVLKNMRMGDLFNQIVNSGQQIKVVYSQGHWVDVDELKDVMTASHMTPEV